MRVMSLRFGGIERVAEQFHETMLTGNAKTRLNGALMMFTLAAAYDKLQAERQQCFTEFSQDELLDIIAQGGTQQ